jgi:hypothetical protein
MLPPVNTTSMFGRVEMETLRLPSRSTFQTDILKSLQCWVVSRTRNQLLHGSLRSDKPGVRQDEELEFHFNKGQFVVENSLARFGPLRFCLWVFLKSRVYINHLRTLQDLRANIRAEIAHHVT